MFPCTGCGACCRMIKWVSELVEFPHEIGEDGVCSKLVDNKCTVYDDRPLICRVDDLIGEGDKKKWYEINAAACNKLQEDFGIDKSYRVKL